MKHKTLKGIILIFTLLFGLDSVSASEMAFEFGKKASVTPLARHVTTTTVSYDSPVQMSSSPRNSSGKSGWRSS